MSKTNNIRGEIECWNCHKVVHYARDCNSREVRIDKGKISNNVKDSAKTKGNFIFQNVLIDYMPAQSVIDTGSEVTMIDNSLRKELGLELLSKKPTDVYSVDSSKVSTEGYVLIYVTLKINGLEKCFSQVLTQGI